MQGVDRGTAEEFYSRLSTNAQVLIQSGNRFALEGDQISAIACALGADAAMLESVVWERLNIAPRAPQRQFFQAVATVAASVDGLEGLENPDGLSARDFLTVVRERMVAAFDAGLAAEVVDRWPSLEHLDGVAMPTGAQIDDHRSSLLQSMSASEFVTARRRASGQAMLSAQSCRVRGAIPEAIEAAYDSDFLAMEAYLVESAEAIGDHGLFTVVARRELVGQSLAELTGLPADFSDAVAAIRDAMVAGLGEADGARLRTALIDLP